jgi:hypothetical protein
MGKTKQGNPLKYFNDLKDQRTKDAQNTLKKFQANNSIVNATDAAETSDMSMIPTNTMRSASKAANVTYDKQFNKNFGMQFGVGADLNTSGGKAFMNPTVDASITRGGFSAGASYDPATHKWSGNVGYNKGPFNINLKTQKKGGATKKKKK